jgi:hypothetical protein
MKHWMFWIGPSIACALVIITRDYGWVVGAFCTLSALAYARYLDLKHPLVTRAASADSRSTNR